MAQNLTQDEALAVAFDALRVLTYPGPAARALGAADPMALRQANAARLALAAHLPVWEPRDHWMVGTAYALGRKAEEWADYAVGPRWSE